MFNEDYKTIQRMAPLLQRVLIVDPQPSGARLIGDLMRNIAHSQIWMAASTPKALGVIKSVEPQVIFVEASGPGVDGADFTRALRRSDLSARQAPVIMVTANATAAGIIAARDAGVHEFLRKPFTTKDLLRRLEAITLRPRDWIEAVTYVGPDRRRFNSGDYTGALKRRSDARATPDAARILQALKILKSAVGAIEGDPVQALRSMQAQAADLQKAAVAVSDMKLSTASADFQRFLIQAAARGPLISAEVAKHAQPLIDMMPKDAGRDAEAA
ncbi:MAG: response regulator [Phenylobacterium sp.]|uniref:response regulator transcription factor n=1 Tax=Phenylobacterium sp. TaxID=1871053 RepID=UPI002733960D|nr:response regulator [Phenylobacterium sp.]MDP3173430.1 response regulator [Phenylobacterium sp.]